MRSGIVLLSILAAGCHHAALHYTLVPDGPRTLVRPPIRSSAEIRLAKVHQKPAPNCSIHTEFADLRWIGKTPRVRLGPDERDSMYTDTLKAVDDFRNALFSRAAAGCFTRAERIEILNGITEHAALPTPVAYLLRFGTLGQAGFIELTPDFRLKVVSPIQGGYQIAYYSIAAAPRDDRVRLALTSLEGSAGAANVPPPLADLPSRFGYVRILFWTSRSSADHHAAILAAQDHAILDDATRIFQAQPEGSCKVALPAGVICLAIPPDRAVNAQLRVTLNGNDAYVGIGGSLRELVPRPHPSDLEVRRIFRGKSVPVTSDSGTSRIDQLVLLPGDAITLRNVSQ